MADVKAYGFELSGVPFGIGQDITVENEGFDPGSWEWTVQDGENPKDAHTMFGRDKLQGPTWAWTLSTNSSTEEAALAAAGRLATAWRAEHIRDDPGAVLPLRYSVGGRTRRVYGRPRRWAAPPTNRIMSGYWAITADFKCVDALHYDDIAQSAVITIVTEATGGFVLPATLPITTQPSAQREGVLAVGGDAPTYPILRIDGPVVNPWVEGLDWRLDLSTSLVEGQYVEIDTRPWRNTILRNGTANLSGSLGRRQWLSQVRMLPGNQEISFGGSSSTGTATCTVSWRNAHNTL